MKLGPRFSPARLLTLIIFTVGLFGCDYASKSAAKATLAGADAIPVAPAVLHGAVELRYSENDDIAFNALRQLGIPRSPALLLGLSGAALLALVAIAVAGRRRKAASGSSDSRPTPSSPSSPSRDRVTQPIAYALIFGGALGNLVDRVTRGVVIDFIHIRGWPIFNVADIAVVAGMGLLLLAQLAKRRGEGGATPSP